MIVNIVTTLILVAIFGGAIVYIVKSKKSGKKCIGCPGGCPCGSKESSCGACKSRKE